jgi:hypothetical protein
MVAMNVTIVEELMRRECAAPMESLEVSVAAPPPPKFQDPSWWCVYGRLGIFSPGFLRDRVVPQATSRPPEACRGWVSVTYLLFVIYLVCWSVLNLHITSARCG